MLAVATVSSGCASLGDPFLLSFDTNARYQSEAVTAEGIDAYKSTLIVAGDVAESGKVQRYFEAALRYDPTNTEAARYLALVEDYRANRFAAAVKDADILLKKRGRSSDDEYRLLMAVRKAQAIYPRDDATVRLVRATVEPRKQYVAARLAEVGTMRATVSPDSRESAREKVSVDAFKIVLKVRDVEPGNMDGSKAFRELKSEISSIVEKRIAAVEALVAKGSFDEARSTLSLVKDLDSKIGGTFEPEIAKSEYGLYLAWAKYYEGRKEWSKADSRIHSALLIQKGGDAMALQKRIASAAAAEERGSSFGAGLVNLDRYIASGELLRAQRLLASLSKTTSKSSERAELDKRRRQMVDALAGIYSSAVAAYRAERFKDAVTAFETVVAIDSTYEDAAEYLDKARTKQKLLDQY
ncbi:MAG: hypothetical protein CVV51_05095 [Spirochaetae bacterium HGW-Spirochaetae-7]|nr:MAG: hypothetical protein CVV51_05095 [Spirochaetae bacterium HGW-Spirochaetae-7]